MAALPYALAVKVAPPAFGVLAQLCIAYAAAVVDDGQIIFLAAAYEFVDEHRRNTLFFIDLPCPYRTE